MPVHITHGLRRNAAHRRDGVAYVDGATSRTWGEFEHRVARYAGALQHLGAADGERVAVLAENSAAMLESYMAAPWAGAILAPVNTRWSEREMIDMARDCEPRVLAADASFEARARVIAERSPSVTTLIWVGSGAAPEGFVDLETLIETSEPVDDALLPPSDCFALFYTGGTTGRPKGVMLSGAGCQLGALSSAGCLGISAGSRVLHSAPMFHMAAGGLIFMQLMRGATGVIARFDPALVLGEIERNAVTHAVWVPTMLRMILDSPAFTPQAVASLRHIMYGAAPMPEALLRRALRAFPNAAFTHGYAMTETSALGCYLGPEDHDPDGPNPHRLRSAGRPAPGVEIKIVGPDGIEAERGTTGEICIRGPVALGYWRNPEATREAMRKGWMHTGDGGRIDADGYVYVLDRLKDMIITGGENVYSAEVENAVALFEPVAECAVVGIADPQWGETVTAIVRLKPGAAFDEAELLAHCRRLIAGYKAPRRVIVREEPFPLSGAGKVLKTELRRLYAATTD